MKLKPLSLLAPGILAALVATQTARAVGPNYQGPPPEESSAPSSFKNGDSDSSGHKRRHPGAAAGQKPAPAKGAALAAAEWWRVFHDAALNDLETQALTANQDLRISAARIAESRAAARVVVADFLPNVAAEPNATRMRTSNTLPLQKGELAGSDPFASLLSGGGAPGHSAIGKPSGPLILKTQPLSITESDLRAPLDLNWELDLFGRVRRGYEAAKADLQGVQADYEEMRLSVTANVAAEYFLVRAFDSELDVLEHTIETRRGALKIFDERLAGGLTSELDVVRARADLAEDEAAVFAVKRSRSQQENALSTLLGRPASRFRLPHRALAGAPPVIPPGLPSRLLERRPDIVEAERAVAAGNARVGVAVAAFFPQIRLTGAAGFESADLGLLFQGQSRFWQIGPSVTFPIFEGGRNKANLQAARARYEESLGRYRLQVLTAFQEVETSLSDLHNLAGQSAAQDEAITAARSSLDLSQQRYEKGAVNFLDVLDAERTLLQDERTAAELLGQRMQATVQLIKALGGDWR